MIKSAKQSLLVAQLFFCTAQLGLIALMLWLNECYTKDYMMMMMLCGSPACLSRSTLW
jgi:hypothetical protein